MHGDRQQVSALHRHLKPVKGWRLPRHSYLLRAESLFGMFTYLDSLPDAPPSMHVRSHGEA